MKQPAIKPKPRRKTVVLRLTNIEARMLDTVAGNGWGDGDFAGWLGDKQQSQACSRAMRKLRDAIECVESKPK